MGAAALGGTAIRSAGVRKAAPPTDPAPAKPASGKRPGMSAGPGREAAIALLSLAPALMALRSGDLAAYHGVEHKAIAAYEDDGEAAEATKEHDRCGSHLVAPMLTAAAVGNVAARRAGLRGPAAEAVVGLGSAAVAVEVFAWGERHPDSPLTRLLRRPGHEIQRVVGHPRNILRWPSRRPAGRDWTQVSFGSPSRGSGLGGTPTPTSTSLVSC
jgi:hypothetical protein